jgi:hypothetical protein
MIIKLIIILIFIFIFYMSIFYVIEKFKGNYINTNEISVEYNKNLYSTSSIPYDIIVKYDNMNIYDYGNDELNMKFLKVFHITYQKEIKYIEGIEWTSWINDNSYPYSFIIHEFIHVLNTNKEFRLKRFDDKFQIIRHTLNRYKISKDGNNHLLDIDIIIYRPHRPTARHVKIICVTSQGMPVEYLLVKIIGVLTQKEIFDYKNGYDYKSYELSQKPFFNYSSSRENEGLLYMPSIDTEVNNGEYMEYIPNKIINYELNEFIYDPVDKLTNSAIQSNLYNKLLKDLI